MTVWAELEGHEFDLAALVRLFPTGDPRAVVENGHTYIEATDLGPLHGNAGHLIATASAHLARMNGYARLDAGYRPVKLRNRFVEGTDAHIVGSDSARGSEHVAVLVGTAEARLGALVATAGADGSSGSHVVDGPRGLARAAAHSDANDLLKLLGNADSLDWVSLWKAMEIIRQALGGTKTLLATGWLTATEFAEFGYAANEPTASGDTARHARRPPKAPPARIMTIAEGQQFIRDLARRWLDSLP